jgi:hypothetical protein
MEIEGKDDELRILIHFDESIPWIRGWAQDERNEIARVSTAFDISQADVIEGRGRNDEQLVARIGSREGKYWKVRGDVLGISFDLYLSTGERWERKHFVAEKGVRIFPRLDELLSDAVYIGGDHPNAIPFGEYDNVIRKLPSYTELQKYVAARLANVLKEHFDLKGDPEEAYERFLNKRVQAAESPTRQTVAVAEKEKFVYLLDRLNKMMSEAESYTEAQWQDEILAIITLVFPKYLVALKSIPIRDLDGNRRQIDLGLLDVEGNLDIVEIKKPFDRCVMSSSQYRKNYVPLRELSGAIMQVEKYILYLQRGGLQQDKAIQKKYKNALPDNLNVKIVNPRGMVILGRSNTLNSEQRGDFEVVRRKYSRIADIITYDDLIRRLEILRDTMDKLRNDQDLE